MKTFVPEQRTGSTYFSALHDPKFRSVFLSIRFYLRRTPETAPVYALLSDLLTASSADYPSGAALSMRLDSLYAADFSGRVSSCGDRAALIFTASWLDDRLALEQEPVTAEMLALVTGCLLHPNAENGAFCDPEFRICKQNLLDDIDCEKNDKREYALQKAVELAYQGEPAAISVRGSRSDAEAITPAQAYQVWQEILRTAEIRIYCVTPQPDPTVAAHLQQAFGAFTPAAPQSFFAPSPCKAKPAVSAETMSAEQSKIVVMYKYDDLTHEEEYMLCSLLGGISDSMLFTNLREKQQLCYYILLQCAPYKHTIFIDCGTETDRLETVRQSIQEQITALQNGAFTDQMTESAVLRYERIAASAADSAAGTAGAQIARDHRQDHRTPAAFAAALRGLSRTQIAAAAQKLRLDSVFMLRADGEESAET